MISYLQYANHVISYLDILKMIRECPKQMFFGKICLDDLCDSKRPRKRKRTHSSSSSFPLVSPTSFFWLVFFFQLLWTTIRLVEHCTVDGAAGEYPSSTVSWNSHRTQSLNNRVRISTHARFPDSAPSDAGSWPETFPTVIYLNLM